MFLRVETTWPCWSPHAQRTCEGSLIVLAEDEGWSVACNKCGLGTVGRNDIPEFYVNKLIEQGYIKQLRRRPADENDIGDFLRRQHRNHRSPQETAGDLLEQFEVFFR